MMNQILTISIIAALTVITTASFAAMLFPAQEVYAPAARRGYFCEFRPEMMTEWWMPYTGEVIQQVELNAQQDQLIQQLT